MNDVKANWEAIRNRIDPAISILAVTKAQPPEKIRAAIECGVQLFGNNYVQEGQNLLDKFLKYEVEWHFIGHIQSKKTKELLPYHLIHSIDRLKVAEILHRKAEERGVKKSILVEINIGNEAEKSGIPAEELPAFLKELKALSHLSVEGLMVMPPPLYPVDERRPFFKRAKALFQKYSGEFPFRTLSMGTSEDYGVAAEEGSTLLRLGTALFGERIKK